MSPSEIAVLTAGLRRLEEKFDESREQREEADQRTHQQLGEIKEQVKTTNGRVKSLELWQAKVEGAMAATKMWTGPFGRAAAVALVGVAGAVVGKLIGV
jgi:hypothetical protein